MTPSAPIVHQTPSLPNLHQWLDYEHSAPVLGVRGNKARKLASLIHKLAAPASSASKPLISHGGAQSNAMLALARVCHHNGVRFEYHTRPMPKWLRQAPAGNIARALSLGMALIEHSSAGAYVLAVERARAATGVDFVPQGAAYSGAEFGCAELACGENPAPM